MGTTKKVKLELEDNSTFETTSSSKFEDEVKDNEFFFWNPPPKKRSECEFGLKCYRRNPLHFKEYKHTDLESLFMQMRREGDTNITVERLSGFSNKIILHEQLTILKNFRSQRAGPGLQSISQKNVLSPTPTPTPTPISLSTIMEDFRSQPAGPPGLKSVSQKKLLSPIPTPSSSLSTPPSRSSQNSNFKTKYKNQNTTITGMLGKWEASCPFNFFLTKLPRENSSALLSVSFKDLFDPSMGKIKAICHFNFMIEVDWFLEETLQSNLEEVEITVIYGVESPSLGNAMQAFPWLKSHLIKSPFPFGHHHTKMIFIKYDDNSLRFIVCTANLIESDWDNRTQGVWIGPKCPYLNQPTTEKIHGISNTTGTGDSETNFRFDLLQYLASYPAKFVGGWINAIKTCDCTGIRVAFVGSVPITSLSSITGFNFGLKKMEKLLRTSPTFNIESTWPLLIQCSSIGSLGANQNWIRDELAANISGSHRNTFPICLIYPSLSNVKESFDGINGGACLPYREQTHSKQSWIQNILHQWKSNNRGRTRAIPHIKTYCRISPDQTKMGWFLLTSANLSKAAWGKLNKSRDRLTIMSWEAGVLFIPKYMGSSGQQTFEISKTVGGSSASDSGSGTSRNTLEFPFPYDLPLTKYTSSDTPWFMDTLLESQG